MRPQKAKPGKNLLKPFSVIEWMWSLGNMAWGVVKDWGITQWMVSIIVTCGAAMLSVYQHMTPLQIYMVALAAFALIVLAVDRVTAIKLRLAFNPKRYREYGAELSASADEMRKHIYSLYDIHDITKTLSTAEQLELARRGQRRFDLAAASIKFREKYNPTVLYHFRLLEEIGVKTPWHMSNMYASAPHVVPEYFHYVGKLLEDGYLEEAKKIGDQQGFRFIESVFNPY